MHGDEIERIEVDLLLEAIYRRYGYDFRSYARASLERRLRGFCKELDIDRLSKLIPKLLYDELSFSSLAQQFSVCVTEMFRDPYVFKAIREMVVPHLESYPFIKAWAAGCATGEEAYSLAITFHEAGLLERAIFYGTDFNDNLLEIAKRAIYPADKIKVYTKNYQESGGINSFSDYYFARYDAAIINDKLKDRITFANHNLSVDKVFAESHLIVCRNVLIYFNQDLQDRVLKLFTESLVRGGFLVLGARESLSFSSVVDQYEIIDRRARIYRKRGS